MASQKNKKNVLLFIKVPPPLTGAVLINTYVRDSKLLNEHFNLITLPVSYNEKLTESGKFALSKFLKIIRNLLLLIQKLITFRPVFVYFQVSPLGKAFIRDIFFILVIKAFSVPVLFHLHGKGISDAVKKNQRLLKLYKWAFAKSYIICLSNLIKDDIKDVYTKTPFIVHNGLAESEIRTKQTNLGDYPVVLFFSNLHESKGLYTYLEAMEILKKTKVQCKGIIMGDEGRIKINILKNILKNKNLQDIVEYIGPKYGKEKDAILNMAAILVHPTFNDSWGMVILEAMQHKLPVIATKEGSIPVMIEEGKNGFLIEKGDAIDLANKIMYLLENTEIAKEMGNYGFKKYKQEFTLQHFENSMLSVFNQVFESIVKNKN